MNAILKLPNSEESDDTYWFPIPQKPGDESQHTPIQINILELIALQKVEQLNPQDNQKSHDLILSKFDWTDSTMDKQARPAMEELLL